MEQVRVSVRDRVLEFLASYGDRGYAVLRAAVEAALSARGRGVRLGDFSYREVVARLRAWGIDYNPSMLLRILERDYGVIETSYRSGNQHWWRFVSLEEVAEALEAYDRGYDGSTAGEDAGDEDVDPEVELLRLQVAALDLPRLLAQLRSLAAKRRLTRQDVQLLRRIAFDDMVRVVELLRRVSEYEELEREAEMLREAVRLASRIARKLLLEQRSDATAVVKSLASIGLQAGGQGEG